VSGVITDRKAILSDDWPNVGLGQVFLKYTQTVGVYYYDPCGTQKFISLGTVTVTHTRSATNFNKWLLDVTQP
jgi:hypothetical protein